MVGMKKTITTLTLLAAMATLSPPAAQAATTSGYQCIAAPDVVCVYNRRGGAGERATLRVSPGQPVRLWDWRMSSGDHWGDAVDSASNRTAYTICFFTWDGVGRYLPLGAAWRPGEAASFKQANGDKADLVRAGSACAEQKRSAPK